MNLVVDEKSCEPKTLCGFIERFKYQYNRHPSPREINKWVEIQEYFNGKE